MDMNYSRFTTLVLATLMLPLTDAYADIKCWINKDKVRECGQAVPQEYSQQRIEIINKKGLVIKVIPAREELDKLRRQEAIRKAEERKKAAKRRQDLILLQTYTTENDLMLARKQNLQAIQSIIDLTTNNTRVLKEDLTQLEKNAADYERNGEQPPDTLLKDMDNLKRQIKDNEEFIEKKNLAKQQMDDKFDADLKRFRKLKGSKSAKKASNAAAKQ